MPRRKGLANALRSSAAATVLATPCPADPTREKTSASMRIRQRVSRTTGARPVLTHSQESWYGEAMAEPRRSPSSKQPSVAVDLHVTAAERLAAVGQRFTTQRRALVDLLAESRQPLSIPDILRLQPLAQSSVYRNLAVLEQAGVVRRVVTTDDFARHERAEDLTEHHHHLICSSCGVVEDFTASPQVERSVARAISEVSDRTGFTSEHHRLDLIGVCRQCA